MAQYSGAKAVVGIGGAALLAALLVLAERYVSLRGADTDFFPRWYGLRALLFEGRDPYAAAVTAEIAAQTSLAAVPEAARAAYGFIYPLPGALLMAPLALLPYEWAGAVWLVLGLVSLPAGLVLAVRAFGGGRHPAADWPAVALACVSVPSIWNFALVQPGMLAVPLMALALWLGRFRPLWAGVALACAALLKPQLAAPLAGAWALYSLLRWHDARARHLLVGLAGATLALGATAALLLPSWPVSWLAALRDYAQAPVMEPLSPAVYVLARLLAPIAGDGAARFGTAAAAVALGVWVVDGWRAARRPRETPSRGALPVRGITRTVVAGALIVPPAWETNALVLLIPLAVSLVGLPGQARRWLVAALAAASVSLSPLALLMPWRSGAVTIAAYVLLWALASWWADRSARAAGAA